MKNSNLKLARTKRKKTSKKLTYETNLRSLLDKRKALKEHISETEEMVEDINISLIEEMEDNDIKQFVHDQRVWRHQQNTSVKFDPGKLLRHLLKHPLISKKLAMAIVHEVTEVKLVVDDKRLEGAIQKYDLDPKVLMNFAEVKTTKRFMTSKAISSGEA